MSPQPEKLCGEPLDVESPRVQRPARCIGRMLPVPDDPEIAFRCDRCDREELTTIGLQARTRRLIDELAATDEGRRVRGAVR